MSTANRSPGLGLASSRILLQQAEDHGVGAEVLLAGSGLSVPVLNTGTQDVSPAQELQLIHNLCAAVSSDPIRLGFETGCRYRLASLGLLGLGILTSRDIRAAMLLIDRYLQNVANLTRIGFRVERTDVIVELGLTEPATPAQERFIIGREIGIIAALHNEVMPGHPFNCRGIYLTYPRLPGMDVIARHFGCEVHELAAANQYVGDASYLQIQMPMANPVAAEACEQGCTGTPVAAAEPVTDKIRRLLQASLPEVPEMDLVAGQLCMSPRTLSRHLEKEGWRWRDLISECRLNRAEELLRQGESIKQAAMLAGFSSASSFSHAFNRARGVSPGSYRRQTSR